MVSTRAAHEAPTTSAIPSRELDEAVDGSVVIPCLNEAQTNERCVVSAREVLEQHHIPGEVVVVDNGSDDGSADLAQRAGARVVQESRRGYGSAYLAGFAAARGDRIVMADADLTYDFNEIPRFLEKLEDGAELVIGNRMAKIHPGAMPWLHRYVGNPLLTGILNLFYRAGVEDAHCGMRAVRRDVLPRLDLRTTGMEFASEMVIRAAKENLQIAQLPIECHPREGESKLSTWRDGWRHLRFLLVHSPTHLFLVPGAVLSFAGALIMLTVLAHVNVFGRQWDLHAMIGGAMLLVVRAQVLEHGLLAGTAILVAGLSLGGVIVGKWIQRGGGALSEARLGLLAATIVIVGIQVFFSSFLLSILGLRRRD